MISSFFEKTKPITHIVLAISLFLFYFSSVIFETNPQEISKVFGMELVAFIVLLISLLTIGQMVRAEKVTELNSYAMFFFVVLIIVFSEELANKNVIFTNLFLLLAIWRLFAFRSLKNVKHKIFDASLLIATASLLYDWALIFILLVFYVIGIYDRKSFKNWLVPFLGLGTVFILSFTYLNWTGSLEFFKDHYRFTLGIFGSSSFFQALNVKALIYFILIFVVAFTVFIRLRSLGGGKLLMLRTLLIVFVFGVITALLTPVNESPMLITFFPAAVFLGNYVEGIKKAKLLEVLLAISIVLPVLLFVLEINS
ncbi:DUF6427 family protein [Allomuricauda sp. NBRC 101325]|uniref:DUF6427 family protein n=1 Tax=Allomuricauda sp. NBRC 101325 TaxID=1113758 RepID=UPI0024A5FE72|nr:DUF6427 family protein [Muricauda sp. NBRC 101325]GLU43198.1 hypothetical protein Musp01_08220 [Muricauda sp. NBRC 101325]